MPASRHLSPRAYPVHVDLITRYVLENPFPLGLLLLALGAALARTGLRTGRRPRLVTAAVAAAVGAAVLLAGTTIETAGEHARRVVLEAVDAAVAADVAGITALLADDAVLSLASPNNPGYPRDAIDRRLAGLAGKYRIGSNRITSLEAATVSRQRGEVNLACRTELELGFGPVPTSWVIQVDRRPDGSWKITRVTWLTLATRTPPENW